VAAAKEKPDYLVLSRIVAEAANIQHFVGLQERITLASLPVSGIDNTKSLASYHLSQGTGAQTVRFCDGTSARPIFE
jgi:hypothetical protein